MNRVSHGFRADRFEEERSRHGAFLYNRDTALAGVLSTGEVILYHPPKYLGREARREITVFISARSILRPRSFDDVMELVDRGYIRKMFYLNGRRYI